MLGLGYIKVDPNTFVIHYDDGKVRREGQGLAFFYFRPSASIVAVPTGSIDVPFIFNEITADYQQVSLQGQITYRIADPKSVARQLNFTLAPSGRGYLTDDPVKLAQRIVNVTQVLTRPEVQKLPLKTALASTQPITAGTFAAMQAAETFQALGVQVLAFTLLAIRPTPEMAKAIEADAREGLQKRADEAISERRNAAVEQERRIKENELETERSLQQKRQELSRAQLEADIALEEQREKFVAARVANSRKEADEQAYALEATLKPLAALDPRLLEALAANQADPRATIALAIKDLARDAAKIGQLTITPDLLTTLMSREL